MDNRALVQSETTILVDSNDDIIDGNSEGSITDVDSDDNITDDVPLFNESQEEAITHFFGSNLLSSVKKLAEFFIINPRNCGRVQGTLDVEFDSKDQAEFPCLPGEDKFYQLIELLKCTSAKTDEEASEEASKKVINWYRSVQKTAFDLEEELKLTEWWPDIVRWVSRIIGAITLAIPGVIYGVKYGTAGGAAIGGGVGSIPAAAIGGIMGGLIGLGFGLWSGYKLGKCGGYWGNSAIARADYSANVARAIKQADITEDDINEIEDDVNESPRLRRWCSNSDCSSNE